jgi:transposase
LAQHLWTHRDDLFTFLRQPGLDATNWRAELAIRFGVILRKAWGGSRTWTGARAQSVLMSVWRTCWQRGLSALEWLSQRLRGEAVTLPLPPLPPPRSFPDGHLLPAMTRPGYYAPMKYRKGRHEESHMLRASLRSLTLALPGILLTGCAANQASLDVADVAKVEEYLAKNHPGKTWEDGPTRIDTEEVRAAYGKRRFYYVFSKPPGRRGGGPPPGAEILDQLREAQTQFEKERVSLTIGIDGQEGITEYRKGEDFSQGLPKIEDEADAKVAAAAVLSLFVADELGPRTVAAKDVTVDKDLSGRLARPPHCSVAVGEAGKGGWRGEVFFDKDGKCIAAVREPFLVELP